MTRRAAREAGLDVASDDSGVSGLREVVHPEGHAWMRSSVVDEEAIDHEWMVGSVPVVGEEVRVRVAQRVDFDLLADPVAVRASELRITVGGVFEMNAAQARALAGCLAEAAERAEALQKTAQHEGFGLRRIAGG